MEPDEDLLKKYLLGELDDEQSAWVSRCLEENPALIDTLETLASADTFIASLRGARVAPQDSPQVENLIERLKRLPVAADDAKSTAPSVAPSTGGGSVPAPSTTTVGRRQPAQSEFPTLKGYRVVRLVGAGGMGMVFEAVDEKLNRRVALKVMKPEIAADANARARFVREAKAVACIEHDNVVPIFHISEEDECPFLAMPFLKGEALDKYLERTLYVPLTEVVKIGRETALGLMAIHSQGLVHRDLKPGNLWLERFGDDRTWRVKIVDFGLARSATETGDQITQAGAVVGTPAFMAPEQARGGKVDTQADLFSLGSTLYLLATGRHPFGIGSVLSVLTALAVETPTPVRELNPAVPEPLAELIEKLLAKNPKDRPGSAKVVAETLRAIEESMKSPLAALAIDPRAAKPNDEWEAATSSERKAQKRRTLRWALPITAAAVLVLLLAGGFVAYKLVFETSSGQLVVEVNDPDTELRFKNGELRIYDQRGELKYTLTPSERDKDLPPGDYRIKVVGADGLELYADTFKIKKGEHTAVHVAFKPLASKRPNVPAASTSNKPPIPVPAPAAELVALRKDQIPADILTAAGYDNAKKTPDGLVGILGIPKPMHRDALLGVAFSPNGRWLASASFDGTIILSDPETGVAKRTLLGHTAGVFAVAFTKDNKTLVSASIDGTIRLWPVEANDKPEVVDTGLGPTVWLSMALSPDNKWIAAGNDAGTIRLWKFGDWKNPADITDLEKKIALRTLAFSPDGEILAAGGVNHKDEAADAFLFRTDTRKLDSQWPTEGRGVLSIRFSRDGKKLATGTGPGHPRGMARVWDLEKKKILFDVQQFRDFTHALELNADATRLIICNGDNGLVVFDVATQKMVASMTGMFGNVMRSVAYSPDGKSIAVGTQDGGLQIWDAELKQQRGLDRGPRHVIHSIAVKPDGSSVLLTTAENVLYRIDRAEQRKPRVVVQYDQAPRNVTYSPDGSKYALCLGTYYWVPDVIEIRDSATDKLLRTLKPPGFLVALSFTPDSKNLMATGSFNTAVLYDASTGDELYRSPRKEPSEVTHTIAADSKSVALCDRFTKRVVLLNLETGNEIRSWDTRLDMVPRVCAYDPGGRYLATGEVNHTITLWDIQTGKTVRTLSGHSGTLTGLQFTPDGTALVSTARDGTLRIWSPDASRARAIVNIGPENQQYCFALDRSGRFAFVAVHGGFVAVLKLP